MNLPNRLTLLRVIIVPFFLACLTLPFGIDISAAGRIYLRIGALFFFTAAMLTDIIDGKIARKYNMVTDFGKFMDPLADKIMVSAAFISYVSYNAISVWVVVIILTREFFVSGIRIMGAVHNKVIPAGILGKHKTAWQIILIYALIVEELCNLIFPHTLLWIHISILIIKYTLISGTMFFTVYSAYRYFAENIDIFREGAL